MLKLVLLVVYETDVFINFSTVYILIVLVAGGLTSFVKLYFSYWVAYFLRQKCGPCFPIEISKLENRKKCFARNCMLTCTFFCTHFFDSVLFSRGVTTFRLKLTKRKMKYWRISKLWLFLALIRGQISSILPAVELRDDQPCTFGSFALLARPNRNVFLLVQMVYFMLHDAHCRVSRRKGPTDFLLIPLLDVLLILCLKSWVVRV